MGLAFIPISTLCFHGFSICNYGMLFPDQCSSDWIVCQPVDSALVFGQRVTLWIVCQPVVCVMKQEQQESGILGVRICLQAAKDHLPCAVFFPFLLLDNLQDGQCGLSRIPTTLKLLFVSSVSVFYVLSSLLSSLLSRMVSCRHNLESLSVAPERG